MLASNYCSLKEVNNIALHRYNLLMYHDFEDGIGGIDFSMLNLKDNTIHKLQGYKAEMSLLESYRAASLASSSFDGTKSLLEAPCMSVVNVFCVIIEASNDFFDNRLHNSFREICG